MHAPIRLTTLGAVELAGPDGGVVHSVLTQPRRTALLVYLAAARPRGLHRRDSLLAMFWEESSERAARDVLNTNLSRLRGSLGADTIVARGNDEVGVDPERLWCDVVAFEQALEGGRYADALALYRGDFLSGFHVSNASGFEHWLDAERDRLRAMAGHAALTLAEEKARAHDVAGARELVERWAALSGGDEAQLRRAISVLGATGDHAAALELYATFARHLRQEYEAEPSAPTQALIAGIQQAVAETAPERGMAPDAAAVTGSGRIAETLPAPSGSPATVGKRAVRLVSAWPWGVAAVVAALVVIGALVWRIQDGRTPATAPSGISRVAVLPFDVRGSDRIAYLSEGVADILAVRLDGLGELRTVDRNAVFSYVQTLGSASPADKGRSAAQHFASRYRVQGSVTEAGGRLDLSATLYDRDGQELARAHASAAEEDLLNAVDELARELVQGQVGGANAEMLRAAAMTTRSVAALKHYLEGEQAYRDNRLTDMQTALERAVAEDSAFALAHFRLAVAYEFTGTNRLLLRSIENAARFRDRLSERHRLLVEGLLANWRGNYWEAEQAYRRVVLRYPDEVDAWHRLAELQFHRMPALGRPFTEARQAFERVLALEPENENALHHLTRIAAYSGQATELDTLTSRALATAQPGQAIELRAIRAFANRNAAEQERAVAAAAALSPTDARVVALRVASYTGDIRGAEAILARLVESASPPEVRVLAYLQLAEFAAAGGRWREARQRLRHAAADASFLALAVEASHGILPVAPLDRAELLRLRERVRRWDSAAAGVDSVTELLRVPPPARPGLRRFFLGALSLRLGDNAGAAVHADALARDSIAIQYRLPTTLRAMRSLAAGRYAEGLTAADSLISGDPALAFTRQDAVGRYVRGELLRAAGRDAEADGWFGSFGDITGWDLAVLAPGELERARIAELRGDPAAAALHYARAIALWKDADPELRPLLAQAEARLQEIRPGADP